MRLFIGLYLVRLFTPFLSQKITRAAVLEES